MTQQNAGLLPVPLGRIAHPQPAELTPVGSRAGWLTPAAPGHRGPHQPCAVRSRLCVTYSIQGTVGTFLEAADTLHLVKVTKGSIYRYEHHVKFLRKMHYILLEVDVLESTPQRPESEHPFPISCRIPSMLWNGEETETIPYQAPVFYSPTMYIFNNVYYCLLVLLCVPNC